MGKWAIFGSVLLAVTAGCTPAWYQRSADLQVKEILRDREETTLGYRPQVDAETAVEAQPAKSAFEKIPVTPLPPKVEPPIEPAKSDLPYAPLGPDFETVRRAATMPAIEDAYGIDLENRRSAESLQLGPPRPGEMGVKLDLFGSLEYAV